MSIEYTPTMLRGLCLTLLFATTSGYGASQSTLSIQATIDQSGCPVVLLRLKNTSASSLHLDPEPPLLEVTNLRGKSVRSTHSPGYFDGNDPVYYVLIPSNAEYTYKIDLRADYELTDDGTYLVATGGSTYVDPIGHQRLLMPRKTVQVSYNGCKRHRHLK